MKCKPISVHTLYSHNENKSNIKDGEEALNKSRQQLRNEMF